MAKEFRVKKTTKNYVSNIGGSGGRHGGPNSFIFMQFSAKIVRNNPNLGVSAPPGENPGSATVQKQGFIQNGDSSMSIKQSKIKPLIFCSANAFHD